MYRLLLALLSVALIVSITAAQTNNPSHTSTILDERCIALERKGPAFSPLVRSCQFAVSLRASLPSFVCEETAEGEGYPQTLTPIVIHARITYEDGRNHYTDVIVNGARAPGENVDVVDLITTVVTRDFGGALTDLFRTPPAATFDFTAEAVIAGSRTAIYRFRIPASNNTFWPISDTKTVLYPKYTGELYVDVESGRPLRLTVRLAHPPKTFRVRDAIIDTTYGNVNIADLGAFVLPQYSTASVCLRVPGSQPGCIRASISFHDCKKFAGRARIVDIDTSDGRSELR